MSAAAAQPPSADGQAPAGTSPPRPTLNILDSVCVLYFAASGQIKLLVSILTAANYAILLPAEVLLECENRAKQQGWDIHRLRAAVGGRIQMLPEITAAQPAALRTLADVRRGHPKGASGSADLGECVCITHALGAQRQDIPVVVSLDDGDGQALADAKRVEYVTIEDTLVIGVEHGALTRGDARKAYERMLPYGSSLPTWDANDLKTRLKRSKH